MKHVRIKPAAFALCRRLLLAACVLLAGVTQAALAQVGGPSMVMYQPGVAYKTITPAQPMNPAARRIQVIEVFSYACPHCFEFQPYAGQLRKSLPADAEFVRLPAVFWPEWEPFARAFFAAQKLGVADKANQALFDALWVKHEPLHSLEQLAGFYARYGIQPAEFLKVARSAAVSAQMQRAMRLEQAWGVNGTPAIVVDGALRSGEVQSYQQLVDVARFMVQQAQAARAGKRAP
ncbi:MAG: thiol:disulfide interchange protein DsbA/DsbL [Pseudomonadota bacterium]|nr:thiol:disulfide interchange protein DsbA/DsbL [Pseudomonadota bacterium]